MASDEPNAVPQIRPRRIELPTLALAALIYGGWLALTLSRRSLPLWLLVPIGSWLVAWQSSLQHEVMHGHPTRHRRINDAIGWLPLNLWLPHPICKLSHLAHHRVELATDPLDHPGSFHVTEQTSMRYPGLLRRLLRFNQTLPGRLLLDPAFMTGFFLSDEWQRVRADKRGRRRVWAMHLAARPSQPAAMRRRCAR